MGFYLTEPFSINSKVEGIVVYGDPYIWGIKNGMSSNKVKQILGTPNSEDEDQSGEGYEWCISYELEKYTLTLSSQGKKEPIQLITVGK